MNSALKIFFACSGVGVLNRGIESFFREAFDGLKDVPGLELTLYKGAGKIQPDERVLWNLRRTSRLTDWIGRRLGRNGYVIEQWTSFTSMATQIRRHRPSIVFYSDANLGFLLFRFRRQIGVPFRLLFSNGGPCHPPFVRTDFVQQVAPVYLDEALVAGEPPEKHMLVPYGIKVPQGPPSSNPEERSGARRRLNLPLDRPILLSVGWISATHKRMDYLIEEVARLSAQKPFLVLLGAMDANSQAIVKLAGERLGAANFVVRSVPYPEVADYYRAADIFSLASLKEGFGRVYLEALIYGLPCLVHEDAITHYVLGSEGTFSNFTQPGALSHLLAAQMQGNSCDGGIINDSVSRARRRESVRARFSWPVLAPQYHAMFERCSNISLTRGDR